MQIRISVFNLENLFIQRAAPQLPPNTPYKSEKKLDELQSVFNDIDADIYALSEIGTIESLKHFNTHYLDDKYIPAIIKGNSSRDIEIGYLIRKGLPYRYELFSHKSHPLDFNYEHELGLPKKERPIYYMSRDLCELQIYKQEDTEKLNPVGILFLVHLKSQRDDLGVDLRSVKRREAELKFTLKNYNKAQQDFPNIPIIACGDFNGNASEFDTDQEFKEIYKNYHLKDILSIADLPKEQRATFYLFNGPHKHPVQLDYAFISPDKAHRIIDPLIYRYRNEHGSQKPMPRSKYDVWNNPSDHYPLVFTLDLN